MKNLLFFLTLFLLSGTAFSQDFNYTFYPAPKYQRFKTWHEIDSVTHAVAQKSDTLSSVLQVVVEKKNDQITIYNPTDPTTVHYSQKIRYVGKITGDPYNSLVYTALTPEKEVVIVNPMLGFAVVGWRTDQPIKTAGAGKSPGIFDLNYNYFGDIALRSYTPN